MGQTEFNGTKAGKRRVRVKQEEDPQALDWASASVAFCTQCSRLFHAVSSEKKDRKRCPDCERLINRKSAVVLAAKTQTRREGHRRNALKLVPPTAADQHAASSVEQQPAEGPQLARRVGGEGGKQARAAASRPPEPTSSEDVANSTTGICSISPSSVLQISLKTGLGFAGTLLNLLRRENDTLRRQLLMFPGGANGGSGAWRQDADDAVDELHRSPAHTGTPRHSSPSRPQTLLSHLLTTPSLTHRL